MKKLYTTYNIPSPILFKNKITNLMKKTIILCRTLLTVWLKIKIKIFLYLKCSQNSTSFSVFTLFTKTKMKEYRFFFSFSER